MKTIQINQPLVVGYKGEIGSFILNGLLKVMPKALDIWCVDINENEHEVIDRIQKSDTIFLCIPLNKTVEWLLHFKLLLTDKTIIEQTSLKGWMINNKLDGLDIRSMHILFRPSQTPNTYDRKVALINSQFDSDTSEKISKITCSDIVWFENIKEHDKEMAIQQALVHRTLLVLGNALKNCHGSTYVSQKVIELCERIKKGDLTLYKAIQENEHLDKHLDKFINNFKDFNIEDIWKK
jgi:prephenate dehydrogenase